LVGEVAVRMDTTSTVRVLKGRGVLSSLGPALADLHRETQAPIMARLPWLSTWIRCYTDHEPWAVVVEDGDALRAAALLATRRRWGITEVVRVGHGATDHARLPARDDASAAELGRAVAAEVNALSGPWRLFLGQLPVGDPVVRSIAVNLRWAEIVSGDVSPTIRIGPDRSLGRYLKRNSRKSCRLARNQLQRAGLRFRIAELRDPEGIARVLPESESIRRRRDMAEGRPDKLRDPRYATFRRAVIMTLAREGQVELTTLRIEDELAAYQVALLDGAAYRSWDGRISPSWARYQPGRLLDEAALTRVLEDDSFQEFDLMRGRQEYKLRLANEVVPAETLVAWSSPLVRALERSVERLKSSLRRAKTATALDGRG
jgi:CelD/BcsL family acetyltransferase involved in cellulose biosynthesis